MVRDLEAENRQLRAELDELRERQRQESANTEIASDFLPPEWKLTRNERKIVLLFLRNPLRIVTGDNVLDAIGRNESGRTYAGCLISKLRQKLSPHHIHIITEWGLGYRMSPESIGIVTAAISDSSKRQMQRIKSAAESYLRDSISD